MIPDDPTMWQECLTCGDRLLENDPSTRCDCGALLAVRHRRPPDSPDALRQRFHGRRGATLDWDASGVWRFRELVLPTVGERSIVSHPEGNTPLIRRAALAHWTGARDLVIKHEGHNPTGSFKDRGMTVGVTQARRVGARAVACASTGNTAASLAAYAAHAGLPAGILVPAGRVAPGKLGQTLAYGGRIVSVEGDFDSCLALLERSARDLGVYLLNSINPFRIEGQKTLAFELLDQLGWEAPDWVVLPAGNLGNTAALGKAFREAAEWGLIDRMPRLAAIQAAGAAPFAAGFREDFRTRHRVQAETVATAIRIGNPASWDRAVTAIRETQGVVTTVSDREILEARDVIDRCGVGCEPASAASLAGLRRLVAEGTIHPEHRTVAVLTGHLLKDVEVAPRSFGEITTITPTVAALRRAFDL